jgi:hypothetical protein
MKKKRDEWVFVSYANASIKLMIVSLNGTGRIHGFALSL